MKYIIPILAFFFLQGRGMAQTTTVADKTLTWSSQNGIEKHSNQAITADWKIITNARTDITLMRGADQTLKFDIDSIEGSWGDETTVGKLVYSVHFQNNVLGKVTVERTADSASVLVDFTQGNANGMLHQFFISTVQ